jgi:hypothetical protein
MPKQENFKLLIIKGLDKFASDFLDKNWHVWTQHLTKFVTFRQKAPDWPYSPSHQPFDLALICTYQ